MMEHCLPKLTKMRVGAPEEAVYVARSSARV